ncbi:MAG: hypothetical protein P8Z00_22505 [Anaerolineales bacterium]
MQNPDLTDPQPTQSTPGVTNQVGNIKGNPQPSPKRQPVQKSTAVRRLPRWIWAFPIVMLAILAAAGGALAGYNSGQRAVHSSQAHQEVQALEGQYKLALEDLQAGRYEVARQRLEYILTQDPSYPGAQDKLAQAMTVLGK